MQGLIPFPSKPRFYCVTNPTTSLDMAAVNKALVVQDIAVISSQLCNDTLEDYFKKITGGEGIA